MRKTPAELKAAAEMLMQALKEQGVQPSDQLILLSMAQEGEGEKAANPGAVATDEVSNTPADEEKELEEDGTGTGKSADGTETDKDADAPNDNAKEEEEEGKVSDGDDEDADGDEEKGKSAEKSQSKPQPQFSSMKEMLKAKRCGHEYDEVTDTFKLFWGMRACGAAGIAEQPSDDLDAIKAAFGSKAGSNPDFLPTDDEYEKILQFTNKTYPKEAFKVFYVTGADTQVDRHSEHFARKALDSMAQMSVDQPVLKDHDYSDSDGVIGKIFDGKTSKGKDGVTRLYLKIYVMNSEANKQVIEGLESGVNNKVSVGVRLRRKEYMCDLCKCAMYGMDSSCPHYAGMDMGDGAVCTATIGDVCDFLEISRVTVPAQKYAAVKSVMLSAVKSVTDLAKKEGFEFNIDVASELEKILSKSNVTEQKTEEQIAEKSGDEASEEKIEVEKSDPDLTKAEQDAPSEDPLTIPGDSKKSLGDPVVDEKLKQLMEAFETSTTSFQEVAKAQQTSIDGLTQAVQKLNESLAEAKGIATERQALVEKQVGETRELLGVMLALHKDLAQKCNHLVGKSIQELAREVLSAASLMKNDKSNQSLTDKEKAAKAGSDDFYTTHVVENFTK